MKQAWDISEGMTLGIALCQFSTNEIFQICCFFFFKDFLVSIPLRPGNIRTHFYFVHRAFVDPQHLDHVMSQFYHQGTLILFGNTRDSKMQNVASNLANIGFWGNYGILRDKMTGGGGKSVER